MKKQKANAIMEPSDRLRAIRKEKKWTQPQLATHAKLSQSLISKLEMGEAQFSPGVIAHLMKAFEINEEYFYKKLNLPQKIKSNYEKMSGINNDEAALVLKYFAELNITEDEMIRIADCKQLVIKLKTTIQRKNNFIKLLKTFDIEQKKKQANL